MSFWSFCVKCDQFCFLGGYYCIRLNFQLWLLFRMANSLLCTGIWEQIGFFLRVLIFLGFGAECENKNLCWWFSINTFYLWVCAPQLSHKQSVEDAKIVWGMWCALLLSMDVMLKSLSATKNRSQILFHGTQLRIELICLWKSEKVWVL